MKPFQRKLSDQSFERMNATSDCTPLTIVMNHDRYVRDAADDDDFLTLNIDGEDVTDPVRLAVLSRLAYRYTNFATSIQQGRRDITTLTIRSKELQEWFRERVRRDIIDEQERYDDEIEEERAYAKRMEFQYQIEMEERGWECNETESYNRWRANREGWGMLAVWNDKESLDRWHAEIFGGDRNDKA